MPGWSTFPKVWVHPPANNWLIEFWRNFNGVIPAEGEQHVELNAWTDGRLYQNVATTPGTRLYWQYAHRGRAGNDTMRFSLRPAGHPNVNPTGDEIMATTTTGNIAWQYVRGAYTVPAGQTNTQFAFEAMASAGGSLGAGNFLDDISFYTGASPVIEKAIINSEGNRIDGAYGAYSDIVTIRIKVTNWGEADASPCVLTDVLWDGLEYVGCTVTGDDDITGSAAVNGDEVTVYFGEGAEDGVGGALRGSYSMETSATTGMGQQAVIEIQAKITGVPGSTVKNQASVNYNDLLFEEHNPAEGMTTYSVIDYEKDDANDIGDPGVVGGFTMNMLNDDGTVRVAYNAVDINNEETYVNQFVIVDRKINGTVWTDANEDGNMDAGERLWEGQTVKLQVKNTGGEWVDADDYSGTALVTTTDANGYYSFAGLLSGVYRVVTQKSGYRVSDVKNDTLPPVVLSSTATQGTIDNDAEADGEWVVIQELDITADTFTASGEYVLRT